MRILCLTLLGTAAAFLAAPALAATTPGKPVVTSKSRFRIPYRYDAQELDRLTAKEIRLYVSSDRGVTWQHSQTVDPQAGRFDYQTPGDGEYWFAVRTVDAQGQLHPAGSLLEPGLMVVVDTALPRLELSLQQIGPGKVQLAWLAEDPNLDPTTLRLEYIQPGDTAWQPVSVVPRPQGQTSWSVPQGGLVAVRGTVADLAGNTGRGQSQLQVNVTGRNGTAPAAPDLNQPIAAVPPEPLAGGSRTEPFPAWPSAPSTSSAAAIPAPQIAQPAVFGPAIQPEPAIGALISDVPETRPAITQDRYPSQSPTAARPASQGERIVNARKFQIAYKIDDVGPSGIGGVDVYITQDRGQKWWKYGEDPDRCSPCEIEVPQDGIYGFALRVRSGVGLGDEPPAAGEPPETIVAVDQTPPRIELLPVQQGQGSAVNQLLIRWKMTEENPAEKPISLSYSANRNGPWEPIASGRDDTGSYIWTVSPNVPSQLYVRVEVRDAAGNTARAETPQPVLVDLSRPSARIVDVEPNGGTLPK